MTERHDPAADPPRRRSRLRRGLGLGAAVLALLLAPALVAVWQARDLPLIHDISTDTSDPPRFVAVLPLRAGAANPAEYDPTVAPLQRAAWPDLAPLDLPLPPAAALERAERVAQAMGWQLVAVVPAEGRLEATATTPLMRFKDDVVVRIVARGDGSRVDVRSVSRLGVGDLGTNARRIREFLARLAAPA